MGEGLGSGVQVERGVQVGGGGCCSGGGVHEGEGWWVHVGGVVQVGAGGVSVGEESKGANVRGGVELNRIFLQLEFRFRNRLGRLLASQSFNITHLINAELLAKFCTTR